mgnify:CR=1 FL=1
MTTLLFGRQLYFIDFYTNLVVIFCFLKTNLRCVVIFFCGKMVVIFSTLKIELINELLIHKLMHNKTLIHFSHQKQQFVSRRAEMWKHETRNGLQLNESILQNSKLTTRLLAVVNFSVSNRLQFRLFKN